ncbi:hypothetical protein CS542_09785 [Pedobacter sp. IW39]|nr:hypothetical protein CS542_09785 [Pedobacter sp. IW39]
MFKDTYVPDIRLHSITKRRCKILASTIKNETTDSACCAVFVLFDPALNPMTLEPNSKIRHTVSLPENDIRC